MNDLLPKIYKGVMVSSTFTDLKDHRAALMQAMASEGLVPIGMEGYSAQPGQDVIDTSLKLVRESLAYVGIIGHKYGYGQIPECSQRNPDRLSLTELEFREARLLGIPTILFIMGDDHPVRPSDVENDPERIGKLRAFRESAKLLNAKSDYAINTVFNSLHEFEVNARQTAAELRRYLDEHDKSVSQGTEITTTPIETESDLIPTPPAFYADPAYIASHKFVGRQAQLERLSDWAAAADPHPILLFEAIGGAGKSMLTWEWTTKYATPVRGEWAGCFWYSFYEKGAIMADFCQRALAYMTEKPIEDFRKKKTGELGQLLLRQLQTRPWLLILDGLERVLVAYHRLDAAQVADEQVETFRDQIASRDPCDAIRPEDDDLLRTLAAAAPSKLLITTRLTPRILLNPSGQGIPGVLRVPLPGLRPADAEALFRACGVTGTSQDIQNYLQSHCDCHPLVTGVLAGLINDYLPNRGNFDAWVDDPAGGGQLNLANLDLVQKRNHILYAALASLPEKSRQLLSILALLSESVDYATLSAFNPHLPPEPKEVEKPDKPVDSRRWERMSDEEKELAQRRYQTALGKDQEYEEALAIWRRSPEFRSAPEELAKTVRDLERRGLLQYDTQTKQYDLHPVVRGIAAGALRQEDKERYGQRVVDHFSQQAHRPFEEAEALDDLHDRVQIVSTLLLMGRYQQAYEAYMADLNQALIFNLEAFAEALSLLRPFFPQGWAILPEGIDERRAAILLNNAGYILSETGEKAEALAVFGISLLSNLRQKDWLGVETCLINCALTLFEQNRLAKAESSLQFAIDVESLNNNEEGLFCTRLKLFWQLTEYGRAEAAEVMWRILDPMGRNWHRSVYRSGRAEFAYARFRFWMGDMREEHLGQAERLAHEGRSRGVIRELHRLRGEWRLEQHEWALAADSLHEAVRMAREVGRTDAKAEGQLALAKFHLDQLPDAHHEAEQLAKVKEPAHRVLADLWLAIGDAEQAKKHAREAYKWAWADGEPYVHRYELNKARALLDQVGVEIPSLLPYDPSKDEELPWENQVAAAIEKLQAEKEADKRNEEKARTRKERGTKPGTRPRGKK